MQLKIQHLAIGSVVPNEWNPNQQNEAQFKAEVESITSNGFIAPILVRAKGDGYEIVDGEHRWKALTHIFDNSIKGAENVPDLAKNKTIPAIVIDVDDVHAKKLTIIMNETRGRADLVQLGALLADIKTTLGEDLAVGLPYNDSQLAELIDMGSFDWDSLTIPVEVDEFDSEKEGGEFKVTAVLDPEIGQQWKALLAQHKDELPKEPKLAAGALITKLLAKEGI